MPVRLTTFKDVCAHSDTPKKCIQLLYRCGVLSRRKTCLHCSRNMSLIQSDQARYQADGGWVFRCGHCNKYRNIRSGTVSDKTKKPLSDFVALIWCFVSDLPVCREMFLVVLLRINKYQYMLTCINTRLHLLIDVNT